MPEPLPIEPGLGPRPRPIPRPRTPLPAPRRILVSRLRQIGDVILTLPLIDALRETYPGARIDYLAEEAPAQAAIGHPALERVIPFSPRRSLLPAPLTVLRDLRAARYDWTIDLYGNPRSAMILAWTGAPLRVGPARRGRQRLYTHVVPPAEEPLSAIDHHFRALETLGIDAIPAAPRITLTEEERARGRGLLDQAIPASNGHRVGVHVGNRWPAKRWFSERYSGLIRALPSLGARGIVLGGPGEEALAKEVAERAGAPSLTGLSLRDYWGVIQALDVLVTNDGSPLHAGPALGVPTVGILGPTVPEIWFPYRSEDGHQLLHREIWCRPCHRHECARLDCLKWIGVTDAIRAVERALEREAARAPA